MNDLELILLARLFLRRIKSHSEFPVFLAPIMVARTLCTKKNLLISTVDTPANTAIVCLPLEWVPYWEDLSSIEDHVWLICNPDRIRALLESAILATNNGANLCPLSNEEYLRISQYSGALPPQITCISDKKDFGQPGPGARLLGHRITTWDKAFKGEL